MSFQFPLATVLRYRESIEQREYFALEKIQQEIVQVELKISQAEDDRSAAAKSRAGDLAQGTHAIAIQSAYEYEKALDQEVQRLRVEWRELKIKWRQQLASYEMGRPHPESPPKKHPNKTKIMNPAKT